MYRRIEADGGGIGGNVMHAPVGDEERTGNAIGRYIGQRGGDGGKQFGAVGFAVGLSGLDHADFKTLDVLEPCNQCFARLFGFARALAEILARALVDHDRGDGRERFALLAGEGRIGQREQDQCQCRHTDRRAACARQHQDRRDHDDGGDADPKDKRGHERREGDAVLHVIAPAVRSARARAPDPPCSCRSGYTSRC
jgi:hypothetical protein